MSDIEDYNTVIVLGDPFLKKYPTVYDFKIN